MPSTTSPTKPPAGKNGRPLTRKKTTKRRPADEPTPAETSRAGKAAASAGVMLEPMTVPLAKIKPDRAINPREDFDEAELQRLADSIRDFGIVQSLTLRPSGSLYSIVAGERRWRAAQLVGLAEVPAMVGAMDDATARVLALLENDDRDDLNPVERAQAWRRMIDDDGLSQRKLGELVGVSQPKVAQALALLDLPESIRGLVITGGITPTVAREFAPFRELPGVLELAGERLADDVKRGLTINANSAKGEAIDAAKSLSGPVEAGHDYAFGGDWQYLCWPNKLKPVDRDRLDIHEVPGHSGRVERRAFNQPAWVEISTAARVASNKRAQAKAAKQDAAAVAGAGGDADKAKRQAEQLAERVRHYKLDWLRRAILDRLDELSAASLLRLLVYVGKSTHVSDYCLAFEGEVRGVELSDLLTVSDKAMDATARRLLRAWLDLDASRSSEWHAVLSPADVQALADHLGVDVAADWRMDRDYLELHLTTAQVDALAKGWGKDARAAVAGLKKRGEKIDALAACELPAPKQLVKAKVTR